MTKRGRAALIGVALGIDPLSKPSVNSSPGANLLSFPVPKLAHWAVRLDVRLEKFLGQQQFRFASHTIGHFAGEIAIIKSFVSDIDMVPHLSKGTSTHYRYGSFHASGLQELHFFRIIKPDVLCAFADIHGGTIFTRFTHLAKGIGLASDDRHRFMSDSCS